MVLLENRYDNINCEQQSEVQKYPDTLDDNTILAIIQNCSDNHGYDTTKQPPDKKTTKKGIRIHQTSESADILTSPT